jgi:hypothetical protein
LFFDDFESGATRWTPFLGAWSVVDDGGTMTYDESEDENDLQLAMATGTCWADQVVEGRVKINGFTGQSTGYFAALFARVVDDQNAYFAAVDSSTEPRFTVRRLIDGEIEKIGADYKVQITDGTWFSIKFEVIGTMLRATLDDDSAIDTVITVSDARITSGGVGVGVKSGTARFDDIRVTAP